MATQTSSDSGHLAENVVHFARALRRAGVPVGPDRVLDALRALEITGVARRDDFYWSLAAVFLNRREHFEVFDQAFGLFWRHRELLEQLPPAAADTESPADGETPPSLRVAEALGLVRETALLQQARDEDTGTAASQAEQLMHKDFDCLAGRTIDAQGFRFHEQRGVGTGEETHCQSTSADKGDPHPPPAPRRAWTIDRHACDFAHQPAR
jgi:uncharacterized protein with von Willebrand factor type A (vWA) domain